jgi:hypothetical protein
MGFFIKLAKVEALVYLKSAAVVALPVGAG